FRAELDCTYNNSNSTRNEKHEMKIAALSLIRSIRGSPLRSGFVLITLALAWFAFSPASLAQLPSPTPDGGYPGNNTAEGDNALFSLTIGLDNTAIGFSALNLNTTGGSNTATGASALLSNADGQQNVAIGSSALYFNTSGGFNTATGVSALG